MWVGSSGKKGERTKKDATKKKRDDGEGKRAIKNEKIGGKRVAVPFCTIVEMFSGRR